MKKQPKFIEIWKGASINTDLIQGNRTVSDTKGARYFVDDIYGGVFEVNASHYREINKMLGKKGSQS